MFLPSVCVRKKKIKEEEKVQTHREIERENEELL